jgi:hypothetical protein
MKATLTLAVLALAATPALASAAELRLKDMIADVQVIPEARSDIQVSVTRTYSGLPPLKITRTADGGVLVDGGLAHRLHSCGGLRNLSLFGRPMVPRKDAPAIVVHAPLDVAIRANGRVEGQIGNARTVSMDVAGCGDWKLGDVAGRLDLDASGLGDVHVGRAGEAKVALSGLGDVDLVSVDGPLNLEASGMGDIRVRGGHATLMKASLSGMGDISFKGVADSLDADASGMGEINVARVTGPVHKSRSGLASINVGH